MTQAIYYIDIDDRSQLEAISKQAIDLPITEPVDKKTLLVALAKAADFPEFCRNSHINWDSAFDCLTDSRVENLTLNLSQVNSINTEDFNMFKSIIEDAYADFGRPRLWVLINKV